MQYQLQDGFICDNNNISSSSSNSNTLHSHARIAKLHCCVYTVRSLLAMQFTLPPSFRISVNSNLFTPLIGQRLMLH